VFLLLIVSNKARVTRGCFVCVLLSLIFNVRTHTSGVRAAADAIIIVL